MSGLNETRTESPMTSMPALPRPPVGKPQSDGSRWPWLHDFASSRRTQALAATVVYFAFASYLTWPLVADLDSRMYGAIGDLTGAVSTFRELVEGSHFPFASGVLTDFNAPDGLEIRWSLNVSTFPSFSM